MKVGRFSRFFLLGVGFTLSLAQCGDKTSRSDNAKLAILPESPIVINSKIALPSGELQGPWYRFQLELENNTDATITIVALKITTQAIVDGQAQTNDTTFDPSAFNYSTETETCTYSFFGEFPAGTTSRLEITPNEGGTCLTAFPVFYVGNLPLSKTAPNFRYRVEAQPLGWFGPRNDPTDRFDKKVFFYTQ